MAKKPDDGVGVMLRQILAKQDEHSGKLSQFDDLAGSVAELRAYMRTVVATQNVVIATQNAVVATQEEHSGKLGLVEKVAQSVADLHEDVRILSGDVKGIRAELDVVHADAHDMRAELHLARGDIRALQEDSREVRRTVASHSLRFDYLDERVELLREGTVTAITVAAQAGESSKQLRKGVADLTNRVEKQEKRR